MGRINDVEMTQLYKDGTSTTKLAEYYGVSTSAVRQKLRKYGLSDGSKRRPPKYKVNEEFFRKWTPEMAYTLGFILTDGHIAQNSVIISQKDIEPLTYIQRAMESDSPIYFTNGIHNFAVHRKSMVEDLAAFGITPKKSITVEMPSIDSAVLSDFVRGVIDGDGYVHPKGYVVTITSGSRNFADGITKELTAIGFPFNIVEDGKVYRIKLSGKENVKRLGEWLYTDLAEFSISYKRERMLQINR